MNKLLLLPLLAVLLTVPPAAGAVRYVKLDAAGDNTGTSWANAYRDLRVALTAAAAGDQVWIAAGIYFADYDAATDTRTGDRSRRFPLKSQLKVLGGFSGTETTAAERNWRLHLTILNGEAGSAGLLDDNTMTIMGSPALLTGVVIDGLVFANGYADDPREGGGGDLVGGNGGALFLNGETTVRHCAFVNNYATYGGAIKVPAGSTQLRVEQCLFVNNRARYAGGAIHFHAWQQPLIVTHCTLYSNTDNLGRAVAINGGPVTYRGNVISGGFADTTTGASTLEHNVWPVTMAESAGNVRTSEWPFTAGPSAGPDHLWGTADDSLEAPLRADGPAINLSTAAALPRDSGDANGNGIVDEPAPFDAARRSRINDGLPDAGAFEMVNVAPTDITLSMNPLYEALPADILVGGLTATDVNGAAYDFALVPGPGDEGNSAFTIHGIGLRAAQSFDFEIQSSYSIRVRATDSMGLWLEKAFVIPITNRAEQTVWIETLKAGGAEPVGGVSGRTGPGGWPEHWAVARVRRAGPEATGPLEIPLGVRDETYGEGDLFPGDPNVFVGTEFRLHISSGLTSEPWPGLVLVNMDAGQSEILVGVEPVFDFSRSPEPPGTVTLTIPNDQPGYVMGTPASAVLTIYDSPTAQWSAETGLTADAAGLAEFALGNRLSIAPGGNSCMMLSALLNPDARDVAVTWEQSADLASWTSAVPVETIWPAGPGSAARWCLPATGPRRFYRPRGVSTHQPMGFGIGVDSAKMVFIPAGAGFIPRGTSTGDLRFLFQHPFWIGKTEVSWGDTSVLDFGGGEQRMPATGWRLSDVDAYCQRAMERGYYGVLPAGYVVRLPTEAEWVYAASPPYAFAAPSPLPLESRAWYLSNAFGVTHSVGTRLPNERGIHDMLGNASEWTTHRLVQPETGFMADENNYQPDAAFAIVCGGNIWQGAEAQTTSQRAEYPMSDPSPLIGFRVVIARPLPAAP